MAPLVSVVICTYNRTELLAGAIESVVSQTHTNLEILIVDDASTDETPRLVSNFGDPRIRLLRHEINKGGAAARNTGILAARGDYIAFLDDDDEWEPNKTEMQLTMLRETQADAVLCMYSMGGRVVSAPSGNLAITLDELRRGFVRGGSTSALMAKAEVLRTELFDETLPKCQDWDICIRIARRYSLLCLNMPLVKYNDGEHVRISNRVSKLSSDELISQFRMLEKHREFFGRTWYRRHMSHFLLYGLRRRRKRFSHLRYVIRLVGLLPVLRVLANHCWRATQYQATTPRRRTHNVIRASD